ncbi:MAG: hypothetical protein RMX68_005315 [Aulosira sp. ZfuVER01]|nr:hypothetical protein [Aulosira sp. ZfuVER01]MDZ8000764.1 hypothetical protein [Aulosira sp. DedVER01a]MDZ8055072.1 hypothetical protein [Aulosira sp. ZfuCHP01]
MHNLIVDNKSLLKVLRNAACQVGLGKAIAQIRLLKSLTVKGAIEMSLAKRRYLTRITKVRPISAGEGTIEVHMLLHHKRIYEGLWALYSFAYFCDQPCRIVVHSDGSLTDVDVTLLKNLFLQCQVIDRQKSDSVVSSYFRNQGMLKCEQLRQQYVHVMKLFDPFFFVIISPLFP